MRFLATLTPESSSLRQRAKLAGSAHRCVSLYAALEVRESVNSLCMPVTFVRTMRGVIDVGGQTVSATDRLYLAARVPTLIVWGERDLIVPVAHGRGAHQAIASSRLEVLSGLGHFPHVEDPDRFNDVLVDFLATTRPGAVDLAVLRDALVANA